MDNSAKHLPIIVELKRKFHERDWPAIVAALRQDTLIWHELQGEFGRVVLDQATDDPRSCSPAVICLHALDCPNPIQILQELQTKPGSSPINVRPAETSDGILSPHLADTGLQALDLLALRYTVDSWDDLKDELTKLSPTVIACLYGMDSQREALITALMRVEQPRLALHAILSNPLPAKELVTRLNALLEAASPAHRLNLLQMIAKYRPALASNLDLEPFNTAWAWIDRRNMLNGKNASPIDELSNRIRDLLARADAYRLASHPDQAGALIIDSITYAHRMQANLSAQLAQTSAKSGDESLLAESHLEAWQQACQLDPGSTEYLGGYIQALLQAGKLDVAQSLIEDNRSAWEDGSPLHPRMRVALAQFEAQIGNLEKARLDAIQVFEILARENSISGPRASADTALLSCLGHLFLDLNLPHQAVAAAEIAHQACPGDVEYISLLTQAQLFSEKTNEAMVSAHLSVALAPERLDLRRTLVNTLKADLDWKAALSEQKRLIEMQENIDVADQHELATCAIMVGDLSLAQQICQTCLDSNPDDGKGHNLLGQIYAARGEIQTALEHVHQATQLIPNDSEPWLVMASIYKQAGQETKALDTLRAASLVAPHLAEIQLALGEAHLAEKAPSQALSVLRNAAAIVKTDKLNPTSIKLKSRILLRLGQTLMFLGHLDEALATLESGYSLSPSHTEIAHSYARVLLSCDKPRQALEPIIQVLETFPETEHPYLDHAQCILALVPPATRTQVMAALGSVRRALDIAPENLLAKGMLADLTAASGDYPRALEVYRQALDTELVSDPAWRARLWIGMGKTALALGQIETAIAALQEAEQTDPDNPMVQRLLCEAYDAAGLAENAYQAANGARTMAPDDIDLLLWFAEKIYGMRANPGVQLHQATSDALQALERATQLNSERADLLVKLAEFQIKSGEERSAHKSLLRIIPADHPIAANGNPKPAPTVQDLRLSAPMLTSLEDYDTAVKYLEYALEKHKSKGESTGEFSEYDSVTLDLLDELFSAYVQAGNQQAALLAIDQAIEIDPWKASLHLQKADLLLQMDPVQVDDENPERLHNQAVISALETALSIQPENPITHLRAARIQRAIGDLPRAYAHAEQALHYLSGNLTGNPQDISKLTVCILAADLARAMLLFDHAEKILKDCPLEAIQGEIQEQVAYHCLRGELALESGELDPARQALAAAIELAPDHPRLLALQSRLMQRLADPIRSPQSTPPGIDSHALNRFTMAMQALNIDPPEKIKITTDNWVESSRSKDTQLALAETALELRLWQPAIELLQKSQILHPIEPYTQMCLARALVLRAEYQRLCQVASAVSHAPGIAVRTEPVFRQFLTSIDDVDEQLTSWSNESLETLGDFRQALETASVEALIKHPLYMVKRWRARGEAVFNPSEQAVDALAELPSNPEDTMARVGCLWEVGDLPAAGRVAQTYPRHPFVLAQLAVALSEEKPRQALSAVHAAIDALSHPETTGEPDRLFPEFFQKQDASLIYAMQAFLLQRTGNRMEDHSRALQAILSALRFWPDEPRWHELCAGLYLKQESPIDPHDWHEAVSHLELAVKYEPGYAPPYITLGWLYLQNANYQNAFKALEKAKELNPDNLRIWLLLAQAYRSAGDMDKAASNAEQAVILAPEQIDPLLLRGEIALESNRPQEALSLAHAALRARPQYPEALLLLAQSLRALNRVQEALDLMESVASLVHDHIAFRVEQVKLTHQAQGANQALEAARAMAQSFPENPEVLALLASILDETGQIEDAIHAAQRSVRGFIQYDTPAIDKQSSVHYLLGSLLIRTGQLDQSVHHLNEAIRLNPGLIDAYLDLGQVHQLRRQLDQALKVYELAVGVAPHDPRPYYQAGLALKESRDYLGAEKLLRQACELAPEDPSIHRLLAAVVALNLVHNRNELHSVR